MGFIPRKPGKSRSFSICSDALRPYLSLFRWIARIFPYSDWPAILGMGGSKVRAQFVSDVTKGRRKEGKGKSLDYSLIRLSGRRSSESMTWTSYLVSFLLPLSKTLVPGLPFPSLFCILLHVFVLFVHVTEACGLVRAELHHLFCQTIPFSPFLGHRAHWVIKFLCPNTNVLFWQNWHSILLPSRDLDWWVSCHFYILVSPNCSVNTAYPDHILARSWCIMIKRP